MELSCETHYYQLAEFKIIRLKKKKKNQHIVHLGFLYVLYVE